MTDQENNAPIEIDREGVEALGRRLYGLYESYEKDRRELEEQWLKNLRQYKGVYDPEILRVLSPDRSRAYPKITRQKVIGTVSRLMEMLFPQTEKNWSCDPSPLPDIATADLQNILDALQAAKQPDVDPETGFRTPAELSNEEIEKAVVEFARARADRMTTRMLDQLEEMDYVTLVRKVVFSGVLYGVGVLKGPLVKVEKRRRWFRDGATGQYVATEFDTQVPFYEPVSVWDYYPDLSAKTLDQMDGEFQRHVMSRTQVRALANRPDFMRDAVLGWLRDHQAGNYRERHWETELRANRGNGQSDRANVSNINGRKYELLEYWGFVSGHELRAAGVAIDDEHLADEFEANVWCIDNTVIKAVVNPYQTKHRVFHKFIFEEDDISLLGSGLPVTVRDSQMAICEAARMMMDNAAVTTGPMLEIVEDLLVPGQDTRIHAYKVWLRERSDGNDAQRAVREISVNNHIPQLQSIINFFMGIADVEASLPPPALGDPSRGGSEAMRTSQGLSMLLGAASLPLRDTVRNFDRFTVSVIGSLYNWNMQFSDDETIKGDFTITARGSTSLVAKEVRSQALALFRATLTDNEAIYVDDKKMLIERMKAQDIPLDILDTEDNVERKLASRSQIQARQQQLAEEQIRAEIRKTLSEAFRAVSTGLRANSAAEVDTFKAIMEQLADVTEPTEPTERAGSPGLAPSPQRPAGGAGRLGRGPGPEGQGPGEAPRQ